MSHPLPPPCLRHCRRPALCPPSTGQASIEFIVALLVLLPLLLITPLLGKYLDLAHVTTLASRFAAFELSVRHGNSLHGWASAEQLRDELRARLYKLPPQDSSDNIDHSKRTGSGQALWYAHQGKALIDDGADTLQLTLDRFNASTGTRASFADDFGLADDRLQQVSVSLAVRDVARLPPFDALGLRIDRHSAIFVDSWAAAGSGAVSRALQQTSGKTGGPFPYQPLRSLLIPIKPFIRILEGARAPTGGSVDPDVVPEDRIR